MNRNRLVLTMVVLLVATTAVAQRGRRGRDRDTVPEGSRVQYKTFRSEILGRQLGYSLYLPPSYEGSDRDYPFLLFLHGANENERRWSTRGMTDLMLNRMIADGELGEFIVAIPFGANSFYTNSASGQRWEDMITEEFIPLIESTTRTPGTRASRAVSGISMGGYGALKLAMKHPDMFSAVSAHSAMLINDFAQAAATIRRAQGYYMLFDDIFDISNDLSHWDENNPLRLARENDGLDSLKIYFDCGTEDEYGFFLGARQLSQVLDDRGIEHEFHLYPGRHGWDYARRHTAASLEFHWNAFSHE